MLNNFDLFRMPFVTFVLSYIKKKKPQPFEIKWFTFFLKEGEKVGSRSFL